MLLNQEEFDEKIQTAYEKVVAEHTSEHDYNDFGHNERLHPEFDRILEEALESLGIRLNLYHELKEKFGGFMYSF